MLLLSFISVLSSGCFHKASLGVWQPSEASLPGSGRVALVGVASDRDDRVARLLDQRLDSFANWDVCHIDELALPNGASPADFQPGENGDHTPAHAIATADRPTENGIQLVSGSEFSDVSSFIEAAASADVELLISAAVKEARIIAPSPWMPVGDKETFAKVTMQLAAFATEDEDARVTEKISKMAKVPEGTTEIPDDIFEQLSSAIVDDFLARFRPKSASVKLNLASPALGQRGWRTIRLGNTEAHRGRWERAAEHYREALKENPNSDAAYYNLAVAAVADRRFSDAQKLARQAMLMRHDPIYVEGLHTIHSLAFEDRKVRYQIGE